MQARWYWAYGPYLDEPHKQAETAIRAGYVKVVAKSDYDALLAEKEALEASIRGVRK